MTFAALEAYNGISRHGTWQCITIS